MPETIPTSNSLRGLRAHGFDKIAIALGVFDGVHQGHRKVIETLREEAARCQARPVIVTFRPHPREILHPEQAPSLLTSEPTKIRLLAKLGIEAVVFLDFTPSFARLTPEDFIRQHLCPDGAPQLCSLCVGSDWRFGRSGTGTTELLTQLGERFNFKALGVPELLIDGLPVSSTRIREAIVNGDLTEAIKLLGHPPSVRGTVSHGKGLGTRTFHCPTANVSDPRALLPKDGVYAARARLANLDIHAGIVYVGTAPTMKADAHPNPILELHLFDFSGDLYNTAVEVEFIEFLRGDMVFPDNDSLRQQINSDVIRARLILETYS